MVLPPHFEISLSSVVYQARTKIEELSLEYVRIKRLDSSKAMSILRDITRIIIFCRALDNKEYLDKATKDKLVQGLISVSGIYDFPTSPVLAPASRPSILIGGGGSSVTNNNYYDAGVPFSATANTGTSTIVSIPFTTSTGAMYNYTVTDGTANQRSGVITASWLPSGSSVVNSEVDSGDIGDTSDVVLTVDSSGGNIRLRATSASNGWSVVGKYYQF